MLVGRGTPRGCRRKLQRMAVALDLKTELLACGRENDVLHRREIGDGLAVDRGDDVAGFQAGSTRCAMRGDLADTRRNLRNIGDVLADYEGKQRERQDRKDKI